MLERIRNGRTDLIPEYLSSGKTSNDRRGEGDSLIRWAAYYGDVGAIRFLLMRGEELASLGENFDLNGAAFHGHWRLCEFLIEQGADPNCPLPTTGEVPLHAALCKVDRPVYDHIVRILLAAGAEPNVVTKPGIETGSFMRDARTRGETPLHRAAAFGSSVSIQSLLDAGADREARDVNGDTPLSWASWHLRPDFILELLCYGEYRIHPERVGHSREQHGIQWGYTEVGLLGKPQKSS